MIPCLFNLGTGEIIIILVVVLLLFGSQFALISTKSSGFRSPSG